MFAVSAKEREIWAGNILAKVLRTPLTEKTKIALFLRSNSELYETVAKSSSHISFRYFALDELAIDPERALRSLVDYAPDVMVAPTSVLCYLADTAVPIRPRQVIAGGEPMDRLDREHLQRGFACETSGIYQCTEGFLAYTCGAGSLHLCEDLVHFSWEPLGRDRFIPILTDFTRTTQPIIRHRLTDVIRIGKSERCLCGSILQVIEAVEGRLEDVFRLPQAHGSQRLFFPGQISDMMCSIVTHHDFEVAQTADRRISLRLRAEDLAKCDLVAERFRKLVGTEDLHLDFSALSERDSFVRKRRKIQGLRADVAEDLVPLL